MQRAQLDVISPPEPGLGLPDKHRRSLRQQLQQQRHPHLLLHPATARRQGEIDDHQALIEARVKRSWADPRGVRRSTSRGSAAPDPDPFSTLTAPPSWGGDPGALASRAATGWDVSAGTLDIGRWEYKLRFAGRYDVAALGTRWWTGVTACPSICGTWPRSEWPRRRTRVLRIQNGKHRHRGQIFGGGANALAALEDQAKVGELNREVLEPVGLHMEQSRRLPLHQPGGGHGDRQPGARRAALLRHPLGLSAPAQGDPDDRDRHPHQHHAHLLPAQGDGADPQYHLWRALRLRSAWCSTPPSWCWESIYRRHERGTSARGGGAGGHPPVWTAWWRPP